NSSLVTAWSSRRRMISSRETLPRVAGDAAAANCLRMSVPSVIIVARSVAFLPDLIESILVSSAAHLERIYRLLPSSPPAFGLHDLRERSLAAGVVAAFAVAVIGALAAGATTRVSVEHREPRKAVATSTRERPYS